LKNSLSPSNPVYTHEIRAVRGDGSRRWQQWVEHAIFNEEGQLVEFQSSGRDITDQKQAEIALSQSEDKFKYLFEHSIVGKSFTMPTGEVNVNDAFCSMLGYSQEEMKNKRWQDLTYPEDIGVTQKEIDELLSGRKDSFRLIKRYLHKNGSIIWADAATSIRLDENQKPLYLITSALDITERKQAEEDVLNRLKDLLVLYETSHRLINLNDYQEIGRMVIQTLEENLNWKYAFVRMINEQNGKVEIIGYKAPGIDQQNYDAEKIRLQDLINNTGQGLSGWVMQNNQPAISGKLASDPRYIRTFLAYNPVFCTDDSWRPGYWSY
jgi:PAS domain S-box-containing protein